ncbi:MAG TPA: alanine racemase [Ilumatobacteraceae bacterium]
MGLRLTVRRDAWHAHVAAVAASLPGLVPVVKGNGYGFGRGILAPIAAELASDIAVGTVYEIGEVPASCTPTVLTPHLGQLPADLPPTAILTVAHAADVDALAAQGWSGHVTIKLHSSMRRYGAAPDELPALSAAIHAAGLTPRSYAIHLPLTGTQAEHLAEIEAWLPRLDPHLPLSVSHLDSDTYARLRDAHPARSFRIRVGTALWHGDKSLLHLGADVLDRHRVTAGVVGGYHATPAPADGHLVMVAAGSAHGVRSLDDGRSPFHFMRQRLALLEPPHMHTSILFVPDTQPCPAGGDVIDVQRPLIATTVDELIWID